MSSSWFLSDAHKKSIFFSRFSIFSYNFFLTLTVCKIYFVSLNSTIFPFLLSFSSLLHLPRLWPITFHSIHAYASQEIVPIYNWISAASVWRCSGKVARVCWQPHFPWSSLHPFSLLLHLSARSAPHSPFKNHDYMLRGIVMNAFLVLIFVCACFLCRMAAPFSHFLHSPIWPISRALLVINRQFRRPLHNMLIHTL